VTWKLAAWLTPYVGGLALFSAYASTVMTR
jgi:hypothetical protein